MREPASFQSCFVTLNNIINHKVFEGSGNTIFSKANNLSELEELYGSESFIEVQKRLDETEIIANNKNITKLLLAPLDFNPIPGKKNYISIDEANIIYKAMSDAKVNKNSKCYDTEGTIGFCFGRATIAHMEAIIRNVHPDAIKKIWIAGDMSFWGHHVATMVKVENGWLVLDTNLGRVVSPLEWMNTYYPYKRKDTKEIMVFVTQAGRFGPFDSRSYNAIDLFNTHSVDYNKAQDYYRGYFHDYFEDLDNVTTEPLLKKE